MRTLFSFLFIFIFLSAINIYPQDTIYVPTDQPTIQAGITAAVNGDLVIVAEDTYYENINFMGKAITVASNFILDGDETHIENTIIDGSQPSHPDSGSVIYFVSGEDTTSIICGFTITGGTGTYIPGPPTVRFGGGINCFLSGAKIIHNHIENNTVEYQMGLVNGGGISVGPPGNTSWVILENNIIRNNLILGDGGSGGGIGVIGNAKLLNNIIEYNTAESNGDEVMGGGIVLFTNNIITSYEWIVIGDTIRHNKAIAPAGTGTNGGIGGGLAIAGESNSVIIRDNVITYNEVQSNTPISDCIGGGVVLQNQNESTIFSENYVAYNRALENSLCRGAGITIWSWNFTSEPQLYNNIVVNNTDANLGGGIFIGGAATYDNKPVLINNTISQNSASFGGAVYSDQSHPLIINSILWNNGSEIYTTGGLVSVYYSDVEGGWSGTGSNNINADPLFIDSIYNLSGLSLCIGAGIDSIFLGGIWYYAPSFDYDGDPRPNPSGSMPDIGAQENEHPDPIPVELTSFTATSQAGKVILEWTTATETNNLGFEIERKINNEGQWITRAFKEGFGTTSEPKEYSYIDNVSDLGAAQIYYRLKQIDFDGTFEYSDEVFVANVAPIDFVLGQNYPNPFNPSTTINYGIPVESVVILKVYNSVGEEVAELVNEKKSAGRYEVEFNSHSGELRNLSSGVYFYTIQAGSFIDAKKLVLMK